MHQDLDPVAEALGPEKPWEIRRRLRRQRTTIHKACDPTQPKPSTEELMMSCGLVQLTNTTRAPIVRIGEKLWG